MSEKQHDDGWDGFSFDEWGVSGAGDETQNGHAGTDEGEHGAGRRAAGGQWVSQGGVLHWESPDEATEGKPDLRAEMASPWAQDEVDLPPGAPDSARIRAARAWLIRQRQLETEEVGALLLERRATGGDEVTSDEGEGPFDRALAEHQAVIETYERTLEALGDFAAHNGPARVLVELYLWLNERLAMLAAMPEAPEAFAERLLLVPIEDEENTGNGRKETPTPRSRAQWQGCAEALLRARRRVEQVSAPEPED